MKQFTEQELIQIWVKIGKRNPWIKHAYDPPFNEKSFVKCNSIQEMQDKINGGGWCLGQAFYWCDICLINQIDGGDEYLVIKQDCSFESFSVDRMIESDTFIDHILAIDALTTHP